jgi:hypothetical protein
VQNNKKDQEVNKYRRITSHPICGVKTGNANKEMDPEKETGIDS